MISTPHPETLLCMVTSLAPVMVPRTGQQVPRTHQIMTKPATPFFLSLPFASPLKSKWSWQALHFFLNFLSSNLPLALFFLMLCGTNDPITGLDISYRSTWTYQKSLPQSMQERHSQFRQRATCFSTCTFFTDSPHALHVKNTIFS